MALWAAAQRQFRRSLGIVLAMLLGASLVMVVSAHDGDTAKIHGCVNTGTGVLRVIDANGTCRSNETALDWNIQGPAAPPPATGTVIGYVGTWQPLAGVTVYLSGTNIITTTDATGRFVLENVPLGVWGVTLYRYDSRNQVECSGFTSPVQLTQAGQVVELPGYHSTGYCTGVGTR
ncbi:MAG: carboxypeptidase-like regulatory domain-containing protein [Chloroflexota bacterium]|nr:carboxypeptidase-like regulatory domain-containing protein [Chloroflexota bacterium]